MRESNFQKQLIKDISQLLPGCIILKNDPTYIQGVPDLTVFWRDKWATLEVKKSRDADIQPNQEYYCKLMNEMSFSRFVYPENKEEVLRDLQQTFRFGRTTRLPGGQ